MDTKIKLTIQLDSKSNDPAVKKLDFMVKLILTKAPKTPNDLIEEFSKGGAIDVLDNALKDIHKHNENISGYLQLNKNDKINDTLKRNLIREVCLEYCFCGEKYSRKVSIKNGGYKPGETLNHFVKSSFDQIRGDESFAFIGTRYRKWS